MCWPVQSRIAAAPDPILQRHPPSCGITTGLVLLSLHASRAGRLYSRAVPPSSAPALHALAGEAADDDIEDGDDAVHDGHDDGTDGVDDSHDTAADGLEHTLDLFTVVSFLLEVSPGSGV